MKKIPAKPLTQKEVTAICTIFKGASTLKGRRNYALFCLGIDTMLRISDLIKLTIGDVARVDGKDFIIPSDMRVVQKKTDRPVTCSLSEETRNAVGNYLIAYRRYNENCPLFPVGIRMGQMIISEMTRRIGLGKGYSPHSLRKTKPTIIYHKTGDIESVRRLLGHTSVIATSAYLGIDDNFALKLAQDTDVFA